jgi:hypothetical protein
MVAVCSPDNFAGQKREGYAVEAATQLPPTGRIKYSPRNPAYAPFELTLGKDARIISRVVQRITRYL